LKDPYDIKVTQDLVDPTLVHVSMKLPISMVVRSERGLIDLPENPTIQSTEEARKLLAESLADWMTRGNMRHEDKPDPRVAAAFVHESGDKCGCFCHAGPTRHIVACYNRCPKCGFRTVLP